MKKVQDALKHLFIPHEGNEYKPHFFRELSVAVLLCAGIVFFGVSASSSFAIHGTDLGAAVLPAVLTDLTNQARTSDNEATLTESPILENAASMKAADMAAKGYFAHTSPDGLTPWYWFQKAGYTFIYAGENLAIDFTQSSDVENAWLASPTHRANILNDHFTQIGIATEDGMYEGHQTTFVVQMFGTPVVFADAPSSAPVSEAPTAQKDISPAPTTPSKPIALAPAVKGASISVNPPLQTLTDTPQFIAVENTALAEQAQAQTQAQTAAAPIAAAHAPVHYSTWYDRFLFWSPNYVGIVYDILIGIVSIALILMVGIEIKRQHPKNIMYGILVLLVFVSFVYINQTFFVMHLMI